ncbi:pleckstrin homology domain-containing family H member 3 isoform X2 [Rhinoraja longicauda]
MQWQQMTCVVHYAGSRVKVTVGSHTTAGEVTRSLLLKLDLQKSRNHFGLFAESRGEEWPLAEGMVIADIIARFSTYVDDPDSQWRFYFRILCILDSDAPQSNIELSLVFEKSCAGCPEPRWLAIGTKGVSLYKQGETESVESFDYQQMSSFEATDKNTFKITLSKRHLLLESCKVQEIAELMKIYSANHVRTRTRTRTGGYQIKPTSPVSWLVQPHHAPDTGRTGP